MTHVIERICLQSTQASSSSRPEEENFATQMSIAISPMLLINLVMPLKYYRRAPCIPHLLMTPLARVEVTKYVSSRSSLYGEGDVSDSIPKRLVNWIGHSSVKFCIVLNIVADERSGRICQYLGCLDFETYTSGDEPSSKHSSTMK